MPRSNPVKGTETDLILNTFGGRGVFRASQPLAINIYSWNMGTEAALLHTATNGTQFEVGVRETRSTTAQSTGIVSPYVFQTSKSPAHNTVLEAGYSHACPVPSSQWYPPYCYMQYRLEAFDALVWFDQRVSILPRGCRAVRRGREVDARATRRRIAYWRRRTG
jgi:hypothetical protein